ncbi:Os04g0449000, partial [Oryza sativa Japonica Group]
RRWRGPPQDPCQGVPLLALRRRGGGGHVPHRRRQDAPRAPPRYRGQRRGRRGRHARRWRARTRRGNLPGPLPRRTPAPLLHPAPHRGVRAPPVHLRQRWTRRGPPREGACWGCLRRCRTVQVVASPADLIKVRMQADSRLLSQGIQPRYTGIFDAFTKIVRAEGFRGLWKGVVPNAQRAFLVNMGELTCYDQAKHFIIRKQICGDNLYAHTLASVASGLSATTLSCPADVIKTRMMNQGKDAKVLYRNSYDCLVKTVKHEGLTALWKGFLPTWARLGPWQFVFWVSYEKLRQASGISSF